MQLTSAGITEHEVPTITATFSSETETVTYVLTYDDVSHSVIATPNGEGHWDVFTISVPNDMEWLPQMWHLFYRIVRNFTGIDF